MHHRAHRVLLASVVCALSLTIAAIGQQPNTGTASAIWGGVNGPPWPISASVSTPGSLTYVVSGLPNQPFLLAHAPAGVAAGTIPTASGIVDLDLSLGVVIVVDGFGGTNWLDPFANTGPISISSWTLNLSAASAGFLGGLQTLVGDPTSPTGFRLTAATELTVITTPIIYVSSSTGSPTNPGTQAAPVNLITLGVFIATQASPSSPSWVHVAAGTYNESPSFPSNVSVSGGYDPTTWVASATPSIVNVSSNGALIGSAGGRIIQSLTFQAANGGGNGGRSVAMRVTNGASPTFVSCRFTAGTGAAGGAGANGAPGAGGAGGGPGGPGAVSAQTISPTVGGSGGQSGFWGGNGGPGGGVTSSGASSPGASGSPGQGPGGSGGVGGAAGACPPFPVPGNGSPGQAGGAGLPGTNGIGGSGGSFIANNFVAAGGASGALGPDGNGGGGGGGGGGKGAPCLPYWSGGGGGGGGGGGFGGSPGAGGAGGGASAGVSVADLSSATFIGCTFTTGGGGAGGAGGNGGAGGSGGPGGPGGLSTGGLGASGGTGGAGGAGGKGGGGAGGPSAGVIRAGTAAVSFVGLNAFSLGAPGAGGVVAGGNSGTAGATGQSLVY